MGSRRIHIHLQSRSGRGPIGRLVVQCDDVVVAMLKRRARGEQDPHDNRQGGIVGALAERVVFSINEDAQVVHAYEARQGGGGDGV